MRNASFFIIGLNTLTFLLSGCVSDYGLSKTTCESEGRMHDYPEDVITSLCDPDAATAPEDCIADWLDDYGSSYPTLTTEQVASMAEEACFGTLDCLTDALAADMDYAEAYALCFPEAEEICDGADNDADGSIDEDFGDSDGDTIADCLDLETCDTLDNDGDGLIDEDMIDTDSDGLCDELEPNECNSATSDQTVEVTVTDEETGEITAMANIYFCDTCDVYSYVDDPLGSIDECTMLELSLSQCELGYSTGLTLEDVLALACGD